jgi:hypothetical protein
MISIAAFLILTIFVVLIFFIFYSNKSDKRKKKAPNTIQKEPFVIDYASLLLPNGTFRSDTDIDQLVADIDDKTNDIIALTENINTTTRLISTKTTELNQLRLNNRELNSRFTTLLTNIYDTNAYINEFVTNNSFVDDVDVDIASSASALSTFTKLNIMKTTLQTDINRLKTDISDNLVNYDEEDIATIEKIGTLESGIIKSLNDIKSNYDTIFKKLKKNSSFVNFCGGDDIMALSDYPEYVQDYINNFAGTLCSDIDLNNVNSVGDANQFSNKTGSNIEIGRSICESRENECIYESRSETDPTSYFTSNYGYRFHQDKWPNEGSCEAQSNIPPCFSHGTLSETACEGDTKLLYYIDSIDPAKYYSSNVNYTAALVPNKMNEWICNLNDANPNSNEDNIISIASNNCEGSKYPMYGFESYDCYSLIDPNAKINVEKQDRTGSSLRSKTWSNTNNSDDTKGICTIYKTCRTQMDVNNHVNCLKEDYKKSDTNFKCYGFNSDKSSSVDQEEYRNTYSVGSWNSVDKRMEDGSCSNNSSCRTTFDIDAEINCAYVDNWNCASFNFQPHASNIGDVTVNSNSSWYKSYQPLDYTSINDSNRGAGNCQIDYSCLNPALLNAQALCHNSNNYRCWNVRNDANHSANQTDQTRKYYEDDTCKTRDCYTKEDALSIAESNCHASGGEKRCYKLKDDGSLELELDNEHNIGNETIEFEEGRTTKFILDTSTRSYCYTRTCDTVDGICGSNSIDCYTANGVDKRPMVPNSMSNQCVAPDNCSVSMCTYPSISNEVWTSNIVDDTINKEGTFNVPTSTTIEEVEVIRSGFSPKLSYDAVSNRISYNTKATISDQTCPSPTDPTIKNIGDYDQSVVVEHTRTIQPESGVNECFGLPKKQVRYTIEPHGSRCPFHCVYYWGSNVNDQAEFYNDCYECRGSFGGDGGGFDSWIDHKCVLQTDCKTPNSHSYPKRLSREGNNGVGCYGNGLNPGEEDISGSADLDKITLYTNWLALKQDCVFLRECPVDCVLGIPPVWGDCSSNCGGGTQTRTWNIQTQHAHGGNDCEVVFESPSTAKEPDEYFGYITDNNALTSHKSCNTTPCCTAATGTWNPWTDDTNTDYGTRDTPNCPTNLCNKNTIELTRKTVNKVTCNDDGTQNIDQETKTHTCPANATPSDGDVYDWSSCPLCVHANETATQGGTRRGKTECSNGRIVYVTDSPETRNCNPQPPICVQPPSPPIISRKDGHFMTTHSHQNVALLYKKVQVRISVDNHAPSYDDSNFIKYIISIRINDEEKEENRDIDNYIQGDYDYKNNSEEQPNSLVHFLPNDSSISKSYIFLNNLNFRTRYRMKLKRMYEDGKNSDFSNELIIHTPLGEVTPEQVCGVNGDFGTCTNGQTCLTVNLQNEFACIH